ncbi:hypothetical protein V3C99_007010, partial [Haemonchus contortus]
RLSHMVMVIFVLSASVLAFAEYHRRTADSAVFVSSTLSKERIALVGKRNVEQETTTQKGLILDDLETIKLNNADPLPPRMFENLTADQLCQSASTGCLGPFTRMTTLLSTAPNYRLATCLVHKNMSTLMLNIICYLLKGKKFIESGRSLLKDSWDTSFCGYKKCFDGVDPMVKSLQIGNLSDWSLTMVTREPIDRILSGFIDRCLRIGHRCYGCGSNMTCFLEQTYHRARLYALTAKNDETILPDTTRVDRHVFPQSWRCNLGKYYDNYKFIQYSSNPDTKLLQDLAHVLTEQKVPQSSIDYITNVLQSGRTGHTTFTSKARTFLEHRLRSSPYLMELLVRTFYYDFKLFGYPLPDLESMDPNSFQFRNST